MNTCTQSWLLTSAAMMTGTLFALTVMLICLFCAGTASADDYERYRGEVKIYGEIDSMPSSGLLSGKWVIGGREVEVTDETEIKEKHGRPEVGKPVEVEGYRDNNRIIADEIEVERSRGSR